MHRFRPSAIIAGILLCFPALVCAQNKTSLLHMKSGQQLKGGPVTVGRDTVTWRLPGSSASGMTIPNSKISHIDFATVPDWDNAEAAYERLEFATAADLFEKFIQKAPRAAFYPAPGNLITRSQRRLLECYRRLGDDKKLAVVVGSLNPLLLPPSERALPPVLKAWTATARRDWETAYEATAEAGKGVTSPGVLAEIAYLRGTAALKLGKRDIALDELTRARALVTGYDPVIGARSLQALATILQTREAPADRKHLLRILKEYGNIYGSGKLWPDASPQLKALVGDGPVATGEGGIVPNKKAPEEKKDWLERF